MLDNLMRLREPAAWIVVAVMAVNIVLAVVRFVLALGSGGTPFSAAAQNVALGAMGLTSVLAIVALVFACVFHSPVPGAGRLVAAAATVVTIGTLLTVAGALLGLPASAGALAVVLEFLGGLLDIVLKVVAAVTLWLIHRGMAAGRIQVAPVNPPVLTAPDAPADGEASGHKTGQAGPTWTPDAAAGTVWTSASDAATGAQPSGWGVPGSSSGWRPVSRPALDAGKTERPDGVTDAP